MKCPTCNGSGEVVDPEVERDMELYCPAELVLAGEGSELGCLEKGPPHPGPHRAVTARPCPSCAGLESHADWCPDMGTTTNAWIDLFFDDDGWYWMGEP